MRIHLILVLSIFFSCQKNNTIITLSIQNPTNRERLNETVTLSLSNYFRGGEHLKNNLKLYENDKEISCQFIGSNDSGNIDELFFRSNFNPKELKTYKLIYHDNLNNNSIDHKSDNLVKYQLNENKKLSFSSSDELKWSLDNNTQDQKELGTNSIRFLELLHITSNNITAPKSDSTCYGGLLGIKFNNSIYKIETPTKSNYKLISSGLYKTVLQLEHLNWIQNDRNYNINHQITINNSEAYYESVVKCTGVQKKDELVIGMTNSIDSLLEIEQNSNYVIITSPKKIIIESDALFIAILLKRSDFIQIYNNKTVENEKINRSCIGLKLFNNRALRFRIYASKLDHKRESFIQKIQQDIQNLNEPLIIKLNEQ